MIFYKTEKQCKERWINHLSPFLKKYRKIQTKINILNIREKWSLEEDFILLAESLKTPKKWASIARKFVSRNCHQIKNRFIGLMTAEMNCNSVKIRELINKNLIIGPITMAFEKISQKMKVAQKEKGEFSSTKKDDVYDNANCWTELNLEEFINFKPNSPSFIYLD